MILQGTRVTIRPMQREDLDVMAGWRPSADPLYQPFDFPSRSQAENYYWYDERSTDPARRLYTIQDDAQRVIGSLTLREIDGQRSARLGITLGADFVSRGYGTEALRVFLEYYFSALGFSQMVLDVAATNRRALRSYRSLGFRRCGEHYQPANHPSYRILMHQARYRHLQPHFRRQGATTLVLFYDLVLTRQEWMAGVPQAK